MLIQKCRTLLHKTLILLTALVSVQAFAANTPYDLTVEISDKLFKRVAASQDQIKQNPNYLKTIVREELMPYVDVEFSALLSIGNRNLEKTTKEQRTSFFPVFAQYIEHTYAQVLTMYKDQKLEIQKPRINDESGDKSVINVKIIQSGKEPPINLTFRWRKTSKTEKWLVYDMTAEGQSMTKVKQQEWSPIIAQQGLEGLSKILEKDAQRSITLSK